MNKAEIIAELPKLSAEDRRQIFDKLCELEEREIADSGGPTEYEKRELDRALADYERDGDMGQPFEEFIRDLAREGLL
jgi:hypothetical protein